MAEGGGRDGVVWQVSRTAPHRGGKLLESHARGRRAPRLYASRSRPDLWVWPMSDGASLLVESGMTSAGRPGEGSHPFGVCLGTHILPMTKLSYELLTNSSLSYMCCD